MSYPEVLAATLLLALLLTPAIEALQVSISGSTVYRQQTEDHFALRSKMESVLARPYGELELLIAADTTPTLLSDTFITSDGRNLQRQVFIAAHDVDNLDTDNDVRTGTDNGILWIQVAITGSPFILQSLKTQ
jgi:hypothetical protein